MSVKNGKGRMSDSDEMFTRAAYDTARDAEIESGGELVVVLRLSAQKGVWRVTSRIMRPGEGEREIQVAATESTFPNSRALTLGSFLFAQMNILNQMATEAKAYAIRMRNERA